MMTDNLIADTSSTLGKDFIQSTNPKTRKYIPNRFSIATEEEINAAAQAASEAWSSYKKTSGKEKAIFLRTIATAIEDLGETLIHQAMEETGLPEGRIIGERGRTCNQLRTFADLVEEGSWVNATIDEAIPNRIPLPKVDIRKMSMSIGPVAVFTASNFPLAFSTAGGDTASALAAGCPVIVKAHPSHLGTNALVASAINRAVQQCNLPKGVFSSLNGNISTGQSLVKHPLVKAVGFTGSFQGGKALMDLASQRTKPIPVYAEMGSSNPIFILPEKLETDAKELAKTIANSVNLGAGQFCTNPGILVLQKGTKTTLFLEALKSAFSQLQAATMLNEGIFVNYNRNKNACLNTSGVSLTFEAYSHSENWDGNPSFASVSAATFLQNKKLQEEIFGPFTLAVICDNEQEMKRVAANLGGQLTATIMGTSAEIEKSPDLIDLLGEIAGRVIFNGVPTGVEVCPAMHHGGPFPAASNAMFTSVGTDAIKRFVRPVSFQNAPETILPNELKKDNSLNIWRIVNGERKKA